MGASKPKNYNEELQAVRAIAILLVLVSHMQIAFFPWGSEHWAHIGKGFYVGVYLFFCLSGFVITKSLSRSLLMAAGDDFWRQTAAFWVRRLYRITPSAWVWLVVPFLFYTMYRGYSKDDMTDIVAAVVHVANIRSWQCAWMAGSCGWFGHYWSLSLEEQFYLLFPILFLIFRNRFAFVLIGIVFVQVFLPRPLGSFLGAIKTDAIMLGVLLALWSSTPSYKIFEPHLTKSRLRFIIPALLVACLVGLARYEPVPFFVGMIAIVSALIIWLCSYEKGYFIQAGPLREWLSWVGERSFAIYLVHPFAFTVARLGFEKVYPNVQLNGTFTLRIALAAILLTMTLSEISYRFIEIPCRRRGAARSSSIVGAGIPMRG
jgi:peptidoglycan/LPS O-acetylase OafA/YrhL